MSQPRKAPLPFDGETFQTLLHDTVDRLLAHQTELPDQPALITAVPAPMQEFLAGELNTQPAEDPAALIDTLCDGLLHYRCRTTHPRLFGLITGSASPLSWLGEIITSGVNAHPGSQFLGVGACDIERRMVKWCCDLIGYGDDADGVFVSGGSTANMTGLVAAPHAKLTPETHTKGVVYYSEQTHSSVPKALRISGIYEHQQRVLPCDADYRLDLDALRNAVQKDIDAGLVPYAVIGNAGAINTGSIDDLDAIADLCSSTTCGFTQTEPLVPRSSSHRVSAGVRKVSTVRTV